VLGAAFGGHLLHHAGDSTLSGGRGRSGGLRYRQAHRSQNGGVPGTEVLHGEVGAAGHLAQVVVEVGRGDVVPAAAVAVGQEFLAARAEESEVDQADRRSENSVPGQAPVV
jgi:hypothetical protein